MKHGIALTDRQLFKDNIKLLPDLAAWVEDPKGEHKDTFATMSLDKLRGWRVKELMKALKKVKNGKEKGRYREESSPEPKEKCKKRYEEPESSEIDSEEERP